MKQSHPRNQDPPLPQSPAPKFNSPAHTCLTFSSNTNILKRLFFFFLRKKIIGSLKISSVQQEAPSKCLAVKIKSPSLPEQTSAWGDDAVLNCTENHLHRSSKCGGSFITHKIGWYLFHPQENQYFPQRFYESLLFLALFPGQNHHKCLSAGLCPSWQAQKPRAHFSPI